MSAASLCHIHHIAFVTKATTGAPWGPSGSQAQVMGRERGFYPISRTKELQKAPRQGTRYLHPERWPLWLVLLFFLTSLPCSSST